MFHSLWYIVLNIWLKLQIISQRERELKERETQLMQFQARIQRENEMKPNMAELEKEVMLARKREEEQRRVIEQLKRQQMQIQQQLTNNVQPVDRNCYMYTIL